MRGLKMMKEEKKDFICNLNSFILETKVLQNRVRKKLKKYEKEVNWFEIEMQIFDPLYIKAIKTQKEALKLSKRILLRLPV